VDTDRPPLRALFYEIAGYIAGFVGIITDFITAFWIVRQ
jgi:hypothetical protein